MPGTQLATEYEQRVERYRTAIAQRKFDLASAEWRELRRLVRAGELSAVSSDPGFFRSNFERFSFEQAFAEYERIFCRRRKPAKKQPQPQGKEDSVCVG